MGCFGLTEKLAGVNSALDFFGAAGYNAALRTATEMKRTHTHTHTPPVVSKWTAPVSLTNNWH